MFYEQSIELFIIEYWDCANRTLKVYTYVLDVNSSLGVGAPIPIGTVELVFSAGINNFTPLNKFLKVSHLHLNQRMDLD